MVPNQIVALLIQQVAFSQLPHTYRTHLVADVAEHCCLQRAPQRMETRLGPAMIVVRLLRPTSMHYLERYF